MARFEFDPAADITAVRDLHAGLLKSMSARGRSRTVEVELSSHARPGHLVLQLLASLAATSFPAGRSVEFGPRAAAEVARMEGSSEARP